MYGLSELIPGAMGPPVNPNVPLEPPDVQQQIADVWAYLWSQPAPVAGPQTMTQWLNANGGKVAIGAVAFFAVVMFAKAGR